MPTVYSSNQECCGTCSCWTGNRKLAMNNTQVEIEGGTKGGCTNSQSGERDNKNIDYTNKCWCYSKWGALR